MISGIVKVIGEGIRYLTLMLKTSHVRKLRKAVNYGETFINLFYDLLAEEDVEKKEYIRKRMDRVKKKFYKFNQG